MNNSTSDNHTDFPVLDSDRYNDNAEFNRVIFDFFGYVEARVDETDGWCAMPLRLVHDQAAGWHLEMGPYSLDHRDIGRLHEAISEYYLATETQAPTRRA